MRRGGWGALWVGLLLVGVGVLFVLIAWPDAELPLAEQATNPPATPTPEPLVPTRTSIVEAASVEATIALTATPTQVPPDSSPTPTRMPTVESVTGEATIAPTVTPTQSAPDPSPTVERVESGLWQGRSRWGVGVANGPISRYNTEPLRLGWYLDWWARFDPPRPGAVEFAQMVRLQGNMLQPSATAIAAIARANPGSLWLIGNEPDVEWQDNLEPATYARLYHEVYAAIKEVDTTAQVAIGGVSQPTPLRLQYLEMILLAYQEQFGMEMPVDVWNVHNFILREERGTWGAFIPPGLPDEHGMLYEIEDCDNLGIFQRQIVDFRRWMAERGYQDRPLIVSEYGIPMPEDYGSGFPPERVAAFLAGTFDFFLTAVDPAVGYPADGYRLVQRWCWYSLDALDHQYPTGRLFDPQTGEVTPLGEAWSKYVEGH